jgi:hypothetical protein
MLTVSCQWVRIADTTIMHMHSIYQRDTNKVAIPERVEQANIVKNFMQNTQTNNIFLGDFNLLLNNPSLKILEKNMINLVKANKIKSTRSAAYTGENIQANYALISPNLKIK